jgi:hypothetical protein
MYYKNGLFFPDYFPWPFEHAVASLHKAAVVNGVSGRVLLDSFPLKKTQRSSKKGKEAHIEKALGEIYQSSQPVVSLSSFANPVADYFPKSMNGTAKYCARCLAETGFVAAFFSLRFIVCCPWHQQPLKPLCARCQDIRKFTPTPFASVVGYSCQDCGYWVPNRPAIFAACRSRVVSPFIFACRDFLANTERLDRLAVLDVLHFARVPGRAQALAAACTISEVLPDETTKIWHKEFSMRCPYLAELDLPDEGYRRFVSFHQLRLLNAHRDCPCRGVLSLPDYGDSTRSVCLYNAALSLFRQKFEFERTNQMIPSLSALAWEALLKQNMAPSAARVFYQCVFYQLLARLWFWSRSASRFFAHVDRYHFFAVLEASSNQTMLDRLLGQRLQGDYQCKFDLPADRVSMRRLLGPVEAEQVLVIRNFGNCAEFSSPAEPTLFYGTLKATPLFYF